MLHMQSGREVWVPLSRRRVRRRPWGGGLAPATVRVNRFPRRYTNFTIQIFRVGL